MWAKSCHIRSYLERGKSGQGRPEGCFVLRLSEKDEWSSKYIHCKMINPDVVKADPTNSMFGVFLV